MRPWQFQQISPTGPTFWTRMLPDEALELQRLASGRRVLEVGTGYGYSTANMALAGARHVVSVDPHLPCPDNDEARYGDTSVLSVTNLQFYGLGKAQVTLEQDTAAAYLHKLTVQLAEDPAATFGLVLIDGNSSPEAVEADVRAALPLLAAKGTLAVMNSGDSSFGTDVAMNWLFDLDSIADVRTVGSLLIMPAPVISVTALPLPD